MKMKKRNKLQWLAFMLAAALMVAVAMPTVSARADDETAFANPDLIDDEPHEIGGGGTVANNKVSGFNSWLNSGATNNQVYFGIQNGTPVYTGITKQSINVRLAQHNNAGKDFSRLDIQYNGLTRNQARAVEQYYIESPNGPNDLNIRNSISPDSQYYDKAIGWAKEFLKR